MVGNRKSGKVSFTTRFEIETFQRLREYAFQRDMTPNAIVVEIVSDYLKSLDETSPEDEEGS